MTIKQQVMIYRVIGHRKRNAKRFNTTFEFNQFAFDNPGLLIISKWELYENI